MTILLSAVGWSAVVASTLALGVGLASETVWLRRRPAFLHLLWLLVLAKFVTPAWIPLPVLPSAQLPTPSTAAMSPAPANPTNSVTSVRETSRLSDSALAASRPVGETGSSPAPDLGLTDRGGARNAWGMSLVLLSCVVSAGLIAWGAIRGLRFHRWLGTASSRDARLERLLAEARWQMGVSRTPEVRSLAAQSVPFLWGGAGWGAGPACIYVPRIVLDALDDEALTGVLCHELAHLARRDILSSLFASAVVAVCWWNPFAWWARRRLRLTQELCCDALVLERDRGRSRRAYAESLLRTLDLAIGAETVPLPVALVSRWGDAESLKSRFQMIGDTSVSPRVPARLALVLPLLAGGLLCVPVRGESPAEPAPSSNEPPKAAQPEMAKTTPPDRELDPLYIHILGIGPENSTTHLLTRRIGPSGEFEALPESTPPPLQNLRITEDSPVARDSKTLTGRIERRESGKLFAKLAYRIAENPGWFEGEVELDRRNFPVLVATTVVIPMTFVVTGQANPALFLKQPFFEAGDAAAAAKPATKIVGRIVDPAGKPLTGMQIVAAVLPPPPKRAPKPGRRMEWKVAGEFPPSATSDVDGRFTIEGADPRATILLQFEGTEFLSPREWKPRGGRGKTITLKPEEKKTEDEVGYVPKTMTTRDRTVDGQPLREVEITWAPTKVIARWGDAATLEAWKASRELSDGDDPRWKEGLRARDEIVWEIPPGQYSYHEQTQRVDLGPLFQLGSGFGQGLRADSEREIRLFFGAPSSRTGEGDPLTK